MNLILLSIIVVDVFSINLTFLTYKKSMKKLLHKKVRNDLAQMYGKNNVLV